MCLSLQPLPIFDKLYLLTIKLQRMLSLVCYLCALFNCSTITVFNSFRLTKKPNEFFYAQIHPTSEALCPNLHQCYLLFWVFT